MGSVVVTRAPAADDLGVGQGGQGPGVGGQVGLGDAGRAQAARALGRVGERLDHGEQRAGSSGTTAPGAEVVQQRAEPLRPDRHLRVQAASRQSRSKRLTSVDTAHAVDRDLFHQDFVDD